MNGCIPVSHSFCAKERVLPRKIPDETREMMDFISTHSFEIISDDGQSLIIQATKDINSVHNKTRK